MENIQSYHKANKQHKNINLKYQNLSIGNELRNQNTGAIKNLLEI